MGNIIQRTRKRSGQTVFQAQVRVGRTGTRSATFDTEEEARDFIFDLEPSLRAKAVIAARDKAQLRRKSPTLADYLDEDVEATVLAFGASAKTGPSDQKASASVAALLDPTMIGEIDEYWVLDHIEKMLSTNSRFGKPFAYSSIATHLGVIGRALAWRARELRVAALSFPFTKKKHFPRRWDIRRKRRLPPGEEAIIRQFFQSWAKPEAREHWSLLFDIALETGARLQEMILAESKELDFDLKIWTIPESHCKTATERFVMLTPKAQAAFKRLIELSKFGEKRLFHPFNGPGYISAIFHYAMAKIGIEDLHFHDLRHEGITQMVIRHATMPLLGLMQMAGHRSPEMLQRYTHIQQIELAKFAK